MNIEDRQQKLYNSQNNQELLKHYSKLQLYSSPKDSGGIA